MFFRTVGHWVTSVIASSLSSWNVIWSQQDCRIFLLPFSQVATSSLMANSMIILISFTSLLLKHSLIMCAYMYTSIRAYVCMYMYYIHIILHIFLFGVLLQSYSPHISHCRRHCVFKEILWYLIFNIQLSFVLFFKCLFCFRLCQGNQCSVASVMRLFSPFCAFSVISCVCNIGLTCLIFYFFCALT